MRTHRVIVLGNPGGGKSTLTLKLCHDLASRYDERLLNGLRLTPVLVILREYGGLKKTDNCSILKFIEVQAASRYQVEPPPDAFEYLLLNGRALVIFDGLDELLDTSYRREISADVESFCNLYPSTPVIVTSREIGYEQAPLDHKQFRMLKIAPFDEAQIQDYTKKWFHLDCDLTGDQCKQKAESFVRESMLALDLRSNPLMLGLMCNLYRAEGYIPRNRPEIYEKCSLMLFERWDKGRGIMVALPFEVHIRPAMRYLAYWIYSQEGLQGGVEEGVLIEQAAQYLQQRMFDDPDEARHAAVEFIEFCTGRAWVFTDTGTTGDGEKLYQFTHRTFLEYFSAAYLFSVYPTPPELLQVLLPHITKQEWDVVAQLSLQIQSRSLEGAADKALSGILENAEHLSKEKRWNLLLFALRTLDSMVPSPAVRRAVAAGALREILSGGGGGKGRPDNSSDLIRAFQTVSRDNRATVGETADQVLREVITSEQTSAREGAWAFEIAYNLAFPPYYGGVAVSVDSDYLSQISSALTKGSVTELRKFASQDMYLAQTAYQAGDISIDDLLQWHGTRALFDAPYSRMSHVWWPPLYIRLLMQGFRSRVPEVDLVAVLSSIGSFLAGANLPWTRSKGEPLSAPSHDLFARDLFRSDGVDFIEGPDNAPEECRFAVFAFFAVLVELSDENIRKDVLSRIDSQPVPFLTSTDRLGLRLRFEEWSPNLWNPELRQPYCELMLSWASKKVSFVRMPPAATQDLGRINGQLDLEIPGISTSQSSVDD